jgi:hypothetical protein
LFEAVVRRCIEEGLVGGEGFAVDASLIKAEANRQKGVEGPFGARSSLLISRAIQFSSSARSPCPWRGQLGRGASRVYGHHVQDDLRQAVNAAAGKSAELVPNDLNHKSTRRASKPILDNN